MIFKESSPISPIIFILSSGSDPTADIYKFAEAMQFSDKIITISLGQGQVKLHYPTLLIVIESQ